MGTFCTTTTLEILMPGTNFTNGVVTLASQCITDAENKIREKMSDRYDVSSDAWQTSTSTPPVVKTWCQWLSMGYLYENLSRGGKDAYKRADRYIEKAMSNMENVLEFKANVLDSTGSTITDSPQGFELTSTSINYHDTFDEGDPIYWGPDEDKIDDISDERD